VAEEPARDLPGHRPDHPKEAEGVSRLSWFPFYVDDFLGGTTTLSGAECGRYLLCLAAQWASAERGAISAAPDKLRAICRGEDPGPDVLEKFQAITVNGLPYLRNQRLWKEWGKAKAEYDGRKRGAERTNERAAQGVAERHTLKNNPHTTKEQGDSPATERSSERSPDHAQLTQDHQRQEYTHEVWAAFCRKGGYPETRQASSNDFFTMKLWLDGDVPLPVVLRAIEETKGSGYTLAYYRGPVEEALSRWRQNMQVTA
jgi:uncharacterized protein YdaU (DUF1376 family)